MAGGIDYSKVDPQTRQLIEKVQKNRPDVLSLEELKKATAKLDALLVYLQKQNQAAEKTSLDLADVLFDVKESLDEFSSQEAPEMPDFAKPVVGAVNDLKTALTASIKAIDIQPQVAAPNVQVEAPKVDLSGVEKAVKSLSKTLEGTIKKIPKTEIPKTDFTPLLDKFEEMLAKLGEIDTGVRLKPQTPNVMKVTNVDGSAIGGSSTSGISAYTLVQDEETATYEYYGYVKADGSWCIKRVTISTAYSQYVIGATDYTTAWTNRASQTYDDYWDVF